MQCIAFDIDKPYAWARRGHEPHGSVPAEPQVLPRVRRTRRAQLTDQSSLVLPPSLITPHSSLSATP